MQLWLNIDKPPLELHARPEKVALGQSFIASLCTDIKLMLPNIALECLETPPLFTLDGGCFGARKFERVRMPSSHVRIPHPHFPQNPDPTKNPRWRSLLANAISVSAGSAFAKRFLNRLTDNTSAT